MVKLVDIGLRHDLKDRLLVLGPADKDYPHIHYIMDAETGLIVHRIMARDRLALVKEGTELERIIYGIPEEIP